MPRIWFGSDHTGNDNTVKATDWISFTMSRPSARQAMNGNRPFVVKKVAWKTCAAPSQGQKMYGRLSTPDGSVYDNSYIGNTISWQKAAATTYEFQGINFHFDDDGGSKMRAWLVSGGPFYFSRATGAGTIQTAGGQFSGTPVGYVDYAEVALPPTGLKVQRNAEDLNRVDFVWTPWDVNKDFDSVGGTYSVSGYAVQVAKNAAFTDSARLVYVSKGSGSIYGLYSGYDWYFRICTRNEVSEHYNLPGGLWSSAVQLAGTTVGPDTPSSTSGVPSGATDNGSVTDSGSTGDVADNNPESSGNQGGDSSTSDATVTEEVTESVTDTTVKAAKEQLSSTLTDLQTAASRAHDAPSSTSWQAVGSRLSAVLALTQTLSTNAFTDVRPQWVSMVQRVQATQSQVVAAANAAGQAQTTAQRLDAAKSAAFTAQARVYDLVVAAKAKSTVSSWNAVLLGLQSLNVAISNAKSVAGSYASLWTTAQNSTTSAVTLLQKALVKFTAANVDAARLQAIQARVDTRAAVDGTQTADTDYSAADDSVSDLAYDIGDLLIDTDDTQTVTKTVTKPAGTTTPGSVSGSGSSTSGGSTSAGSTAGGSTATPTDTTAADGTPAKVIVYTPIPDTSATRSPMGGLLISRSPRTPQAHTVYLMDRGGRQRIGQFKALASVDYNRIRDDQSTATISLTGASVSTNAAVLDALAVGRHELCIFRGTERVWEGPITLATFKRDGVEIRATDITHYLNRTVLKNAYSNAYPALDYVVSRIAGIITKELGVKESLQPPTNVLPYLHTFVEKGDARTTRVSLAGESTVWQHLDDLAAKAGIDYTVVGRSLYIWDTSRPAIGQLRTVTQDDFSGDTYIAAYGMETATQTFVTDGQGNFGQAGGVDDFYGEIDLLATAYDENGNAVDQTDTDPTNDTIPIEEMTEQAQRNLKGRNPTPLGLKVPDGSAFRLDRGLGLDVLIPGVYIPVSATVAGRTMNQVMKLTEIRVHEDGGGQTATLTLTPASASDLSAQLENSGDEA